MAARQAALLLLLGAAAAQRTWQRAEAAAGGAVVSLPLPVVWDWAEDPGVAGYCATARGPGARAAAHAISCYELKGTTTEPVVLEQFAFAAEHVQERAQVNKGAGHQVVFVLGSSCRKRCTARNIWLRTMRGLKMEQDVQSLESRRRSS